MCTQPDLVKGKIQWANAEHGCGPLPYPIDLSTLPGRSQFTLDGAGVPYHIHPKGYDPTSIAHYALAHWNEYLLTGAEDHREAFLTQARWLVEHEVCAGGEAGGWPVSFSQPGVDGEGVALSALVQGNALSVLLRAYQLTGKEVFLETARRAVCTFELDILDGGVCTPIGENGIFFEEVAVYPATHAPGGFMFALIGLYDYVSLTGDTRMAELIQRGLMTWHLLLDEFDVGFWICTDLLHRELASPLDFALQTTLLDALASYSGCEHCSRLASRWKSYRSQRLSRLRYEISHACASLRRALWHRMQTMFFPKVQPSQLLRVCVPVRGFFVTGGTCAVVAGLARITSDIWQMEYLMQRIGDGADRYIFHRFGTKNMSPWQFPIVWLYFLAGLRKLVSLLHQGRRYDVLLPQDGLFTAAFASLAGKIAGVRTVCIDHGGLKLLNDRMYRSERRRALATKHRARRLIEPLLFPLYWPSLYLLARISARCVDHFLIPGVAGDGVEEICRQLKIPQSRLTRFASMVDVDLYSTRDTSSRAALHEKYAIDSGAIIVTMVCRLTPEKGIDVALHSLARALSAISPAQRERVHIIIAGEGPLHHQIEQDIHTLGLRQKCVLWGETSTTDVISLLGLSDIFLYTSTRGACFSMAVLEAMASGCAVIASTEPISNARLLAGGRGIAVPPADVEQTSAALVRLVNDAELCRHMGDVARDYIATHHNLTTFKRTLLRVTCWSRLDQLLKSETKEEAAIHEKE
ncbi:MAG TPA: D-glucuronyl C5-epimerase family protein [Ktedonobacteraceae bacterium]